jgi:hypothetical protein
VLMETVATVGLTSPRVVSVSIESGTSMSSSVSSHGPNLYPSCNTGGILTIPRESLGVHVSSCTDGRTGQSAAKGGILR